MLLHSTLLTLTAVTATALPSTLPPTHLRAPHPNAQSCNAKQQGLDLLYLIDVGEPYVAGNGCMAIYDAISKMLHDQKLITKWDDSTGIYRYICEPGSDDENADFTRLELGVINGLTARKIHEGLGNWMSEVLEGMYPMVNGFNCPNT